MPTTDSNEELEHKVVSAIAFGRQEGKTAGEVADQIMQLILADREAAIGEARIDQIKTDMAWQFMNKADLFKYIEHQQHTLASLNLTQQKKG